MTGFFSGRSCFCKCVPVKRRCSATDFRGGGGWRGSASEPAAMGRGGRAREQKHKQHRRVGETKLVACSKRRRRGGTGNEWRAIRERIHTPARIRILGCPRHYSMQGPLPKKADGSGNSDPWMPERRGSPGEESIRTRTFQEIEILIESGCQ